MGVKEWGGGTLIKGLGWVVVVVVMVLGGEGEVAEEDGLGQVAVGGGAGWQWW